MTDRSHSLPDGWRWVRIGEISEVSTGGTPATGHPEFYGGNIPWLKSGDVKGTWIDEVPNRISELGLTNSNARLHPIGSVMLAMSGQGKTRGTSAILRVSSACSQSVAAILPSKEAIPEIIHFALVSQYENIRRLTGDNERTGLNLKLVRNIAFPLPSLEEQKRIATILIDQTAAVERARAAAEAQLEAAKALPAAYLRAAFSGPEAKQWPTSQLGMLCDIQLGKMLSPASRIGLRPRPYLRNANVQWGRFDLADIARMDFTEDQERKFALRSGDLLVCEGGEPGRAAVWDGQIPSCLYQKAIHRLRPISNEVDAHFVMYRLWMGALQQEFVESHAKTTIAHLPAVRLQRLPIRVPTVPEQQRIAATLKEQMASADRVRKAIEGELDAINRLPAALLRRAFNGEL